MRIHRSSTRPARALVPVLAVLVMVALTGGSASAKKPARTDVRARAFKFTAQHVEAGFTEPSAIVTREGTVMFCGPLGLGDSAEGVVRSTDWTTFEGSRSPRRSAGAGTATSSRARTAPCS